MRTSTTPISTPRRLAALAAVVAVTPIFASCSADVTPPAQNIGGHRAQKAHPALPQPLRTTGNRIRFGDEMGEGKVKPHQALPAGSGTRNRMRFVSDDW